MAFPEGMTVAEGRFTLRTLLRGAPLDGLWSGMDEAGHEVWITLRRLRASEERERLLRFSSYGIDAPLYIGAPDIEAAYRDDYFCVVDAAPRGSTMLYAGRFMDHTGGRLGVALCDVVASWAAASGGMIFSGLHFDTVYVDKKCRFLSVMPRPHFLLGYHNISFDPPGCGGSSMSPSDAVFTIALLVWWAVASGQPYYIDGTNPEENAFADRHVPFEGTPALGAILERALVADPTKRIGLDALRAELAGFVSGIKDPDRLGQVEEALGRPLTEDEVVEVESVAALPLSHVNVVEQLHRRAPLAALYYLRAVILDDSISAQRRYVHTFDEYITVSERAA